MTTLLELAKHLEEARDEIRNMTDVEKVALTEEAAAHGFTHRELDGYLARIKAGLIEREEATAALKHSYYECSPECDDSCCQFCRGGLGLCTICKGFEGTLTIDCCGFELNSHILEAIYHGGLNYKNGEWSVEGEEQADVR